MGKILAAISYPEIWRMTKFGETNRAVEDQLAPGFAVWEGGRGILMQG